MRNCLHSIFLFKLYNSGLRSRSKCTARRGRACSTASLRQPVRQLVSSVKFSPAQFTMFTVFLLLWLCIWLVTCLLKSRRPKNFPPGPPVLPVLGNLLSLNLENPLKDYERLRKSYGNIYSLFLGPKPVVFINGFHVIKEALVTKAGDFSGRPQDLFVNDVTQRKGLILADYNPNWKEHRRFALMTLRNFGLGKNTMEERIHGEIKHIIKTLDKSIGKTLSPQVMFHNAASNIICQVLFGTRYEYDDKLIKVIVRCFTENSKIANGPWSMLYDCYPIVRKLPLPFNKGFKNFEICQNLAQNIVDEHMKTRVPGEPRDFVDCYLDELDKRGSDGSLLSENRLVFNALDLHFAGTDTTSNTLLTGFLYLTTYPHIQERCQREIDQVLKGKDLVSFDDRHNMPYMQGTMIIPNLTSVLNEEGQWKFPHEFNPENFIGDQGDFVKPEAFMPFSTGPRMCLGEGLARMELFLIMVTLLRKFKFIWPEDAGDPDYTPLYGVTLTPKPYRMKIQLRETQ
ncbi:cytochrome P450 2F2-like isoform X2 [Betta splendens]|uniref:Cytochrome P450 2F2-like isoform X2 n=1 Tax=Betta splendens TaxID=158456 RepID=A0A6P7P3P9_BETSP|nr:cytochrome P450 2F2-like isoform X2 [Betta splendens]